MPKPLGKYMIAVQLRVRPDQTPQWDIVTSRDGAFLGQVSWHVPWRRYVFEPTEPEAVFDAECLRQIAAFLDDESDATD